MEGPSLVILKEAVRPFKGKKIIRATGYADIDYGRLTHKTVKEFKTWGKLFLIVLPDLSLRIHFLLFGTYLINERKKTNAKVSLKFANGELNCYVCSAKILEGRLRDLFDWEVDLLSPKWNFSKVKQLFLQHPGAMVCDVVLNPDIFSGSGNIIKNEALYRAGIHPQSIVKALPPEKVSELVKAVHSYTHDFLKWTRQGVLSKNWKVYSRKKCKECGSPVMKNYQGKLKRRNFICNNCQQLYT